MHAMSLNLDKQVGASVQKEKSIFVAMGKIAGSQPTIGTKHLCRGCLVLPVAQHHVIAASTKHPDLTCRQLSIGLVHNSKFYARYRSANRPMANMELLMGQTRKAGSGFRLAIHDMKRRWSNAAFDLRCQIVAQFASCNCHVAKCGKRPLPELPILQQHAVHFWHCGKTRGFKLLQCFDSRGREGQSSVNKKRGTGKNMSLQNGVAERVAEGEHSQCPVIGTNG